MITIARAIKRRNASHELTVRDTHLRRWLWRLFTTAPISLLAAFLLFAISVDDITADERTLAANAPQSESSSSTSTNQSERTSENLRFLQDKLRRFENTLLEKQTSRDKQQFELITIEKEISTLNEKQRQTVVELQQIQDERDALQRKLEQSDASLGGEKKAVRQWARSGYALGRQSFLKVLLTQAEPDTLVRTVTYYGYLAKAQNNRIASLTERLAGLTTLDEALQDTSAELSALRDIQRSYNDELRLKRNLRGRVVANLNQDIRSSETTLNGLRADERQLLRLLETVATARLEERRQPGVPFGKLKGKLSLPAEASVIARFGEERPLGDTVWDGLLLGAPTGTDFHAIADGEVVFSDWFRGYGLLLILDHGDGFMSVYSHGEALTRALGDRVNGGDVIGQVGITGGLSSPGLYFAIRRNGKPEDPLLWMSAK